MEYLIGLQATTGGVSERLFDQAAKTLLFDEEMRRRLAQNNRCATLDVAESVLYACEEWPVPRCRLGAV